MYVSRSPVPYLPKPEFFLTHKIYATLLSAFNLITSTPRWHAVYTRHVDSLYIVVFIIYAYSIFKPLTIYGDGNVQDGQWLAWVRFGLLAVEGAFIPLFMPRTFVPTVSPVFAGLSSHISLDHRRHKPSQIRNRPRHHSLSSFSATWIVLFTRLILFRI
jgi:hypothetical protein